METYLKLIFETTLFSSIVILIVLAIKTIYAGKISSKIMSFLWLLVLVRLIMPVTLESPVHFDSFISIPEADQHDLANMASQPIEMANNDQLSYSSNDIPHSLQKIEMNDNIAQKQAEVSIFKKAFDWIKSLSLWTVLFALWITGIALFVCKNIFEFVRFNKRIKQSRFKASTDLIKALTYGKTKLGMTKNTKIAECSCIDMPVTYGLIKSKILIPAGLSHCISDDKLKLIIMHELCHIKRFDILKNYIWLAAKAVHWFNPLVWVAYKNYISARELSCDEMVLKHIGEKDKFEYSQSLLDVIKLSQNRQKTSLTLSFCSDKTKLRQRVENMIKPKRKSKSAGFIALALAAIMIIACFTTACQPTPEQSIVVGKNDDNLDSIIAGTPAPTIDASSTQHNETWQEQLSGTNVTVNIDAKIILPKVAQFPVVEVGSKLYTEDDAWEIIKVFFQDSAVYDEPIFTKEDLEAQILTLKKELAEVHSGALDEDAESIQAEIDYYTQLLQNAPSENDVPQALTDLSFEEQNEREVINVSATIGNNNYPATLMIFKNTSEYNSGIYFSNRLDGISTYPVTENNMEMTLDEAISKAQSTMSELGLEDMILTASGIEGSENEQGYVLHFMKSVNGIGISDYQSHMMSGQKEGEASVYAPFINPEQVTIYINDTGILKFYLSNALKIGEVINENVDTLSVKEAKDIFREQVFYNYYAPDYNPLTIDVNRIELGYFVQSVKDQQGLFRAIPVWDFLASEKLAEGDSYTYSVLTINAIDGSIVNRDLGY